MNRNDYMELLRDYVGMYFSAEETEDVIRDYEEFFQMGLEAGKTEAEIIEGLGSPKKVAKDLADELQVTRTKQVLTDSSWWQKLEAKVKLTGLKVGRYIDEKTPVIKEKVTNILKTQSETEDGTITLSIRKLLKKGLRFLVGAIGIAVRVVLFLFVALTGVLLVSNAILSILVFGLGIVFFTVNVPLGFVVLFGSFILVGFCLIGYELLRYLYRQLRVMKKKFQTWWQYRVKGGVVNE